VDTVLEFARHTSCRVMFHARRARIRALAGDTKDRYVDDGSLGVRICDGEEEDALESWAENDAVAGDCDGWRSRSTIGNSVGGG
jgi:hypothetical protein